MQELTPLLIFLALSTAFAAFLVILGFLVSPKAPSEVKNSTYECGLKPFGDAKIQYSPNFFIFALMFLIFDIETIMLYPFALAFNKIGFLALIEAFLFVMILLFGLIYVLKKEILRFE